MDITLWFRNMLNNEHLIRCPNCQRTYNPLGEVEDWGVLVGSTCGAETSFNICGNCLNSPETIDLKKVKKNHLLRKTPAEEIEQGMSQLSRLKNGEVRVEEIV